MADSDVPTIAEKVSFWQEQDRINQALIPRVMKIHDTLIEVGKCQSETSEKIANLEGRVMQPISILRSEIEVEVAELKDHMSASLHTIQSELNGRFMAVEARVDQSLRTIRWATYFAMALSGLALAVTLSSGHL